MTLVRRLRGDFSHAPITCERPCGLPIRERDHERHEIDGRWGPHDVTRAPPWVLVNPWSTVPRPLIALALAVMLTACSGPQHSNAPAPVKAPFGTYFRVKDSGQPARPGAALVTCATQIGPDPGRYVPSSTAPRPADIVVGPV